MALHRPGKPMQNGFVESFNGRDECLNERLFTIYRHARNSIEEWRIDYNVNRPHTSLDGLTPSEFATRSISDHNAIRAIDADKLGEHVRFYNPRRRHSTLRYLSPSSSRSELC
jgi:transposase InsO family protein